MPRSLLASTMLLLGLVASSPALAQTMSEADAQALLEQARKAYLAGDYAEACPRYEQLVRARPGLGARLGLGDCYRASGRLASAWEAYSAIVADAPAVAEKAEKPKDRATALQRAEEARKRMKEIEPRLTWLVLTVPEAIRSLADLRIQRDGAALAADRWDTRIPLDGGAHVITAIAPGKKLWQRQIHVAARSTEIQLEIGPLEEDPSGRPAASGPAGKPVASASTAASAPPPARAPAPGSSSPPDSTGLGQRIGGVVLGVVGLGAIGVGSYFGLQAIDKRDQSNEGGRCDAQGFCDATGRALREEGRAAGDVSTALFIGGGLALAGGVVLVVTAPRRRSSPSAVVTLGPGTLGVRGSW